jgi:hypothetical protein
MKTKIMAKTAVTVDPGTISNSTCFGVVGTDTGFEAI